MQTQEDDLGDSQKYEEGTVCTLYALSGRPDSHTALGVLPKPLAILKLVTY